VEEEENIILKVRFYLAALKAGLSSRKKGVCPSLCPSVCQTCELWQNGKKICRDF